MSDKVRTPIGEMWLDDGVLWHRLDARDTITETDAAAVIDAVAELTGGVAVPAVVDMRGIGFADAAARRKFAGNKDEPFELATALIVGESASRAMARIFIAMSRPKRPIAVFADPAAAEEWARGFLQSGSTVEP